MQVHMVPPIHADARECVHVHFALPIVGQSSHCFGGGRVRLESEKAGPRWACADDGTGCMADPRKVDRKWITRVSVPVIRPWGSGNRGGRSTFSLAISGTTVGPV